jgi:hypothetical protein
LRQNFSKSNNVNYRDGDKQSSNIIILENQSQDAEKIDKMYNSPKHNVTTDSLGLMVEKLIDLARDNFD